jgi:formylglycine-generating enzyme required for sulfatase activity
MFEHENREGRCLAAAVELAEELQRRGNEQAGRLLDQFFAEVQKWPEDMVMVAAGAFPYSEDNKMVDLAAFRIDRFPVTNEEFERMAPGHRKLRNEYSDSDRQPVIVVNWFEARLYARWRGCRLPSEQEWEKAAGWDADAGKKRVYPWGDSFEAAFCNTDESGIGHTTAVGSYSEAGPYDVQDMAGNVWEWTESAWSEGGEARVVRGGSWSDPRFGAACACRPYYNPDHRGSNFGFRCART